MSDFFYRWRRKLGCITLSACLILWKAAWKRRCVVAGVPLIFCGGAHCISGMEPSSDSPALKFSLKKEDFAFMSPDGPLDCVSFGRRGHILIANKAGEIWDLNVDNRESVLVATVKGARVWCCAADDLEQVLFCSSQGAAVQIDAQGPKVIWKDARIQMDIRCMDLSRDGRLFATAGDDDSTVRVWNTRNQSLICKFSIESARVKEISFSADGRMLAVTTHDGADIYRINTITKLVGSISREGTLSRVVRFTGTGNRERLCIAFQERQAMVVFYDPKDWEQDGSEVRLADDGEYGFITHVSARGNDLMCSVNSIPHKTVGVFFIGSRRQLISPVVETSTDVVMSVAVSPDGEFACDVTRERLRIWKMPVSLRKKTD